MIPLAHQKLISLGGASMTIFTTPINTEAKNTKDAYAKIQAYRQLFNIVNAEPLTHVRGIFYDPQGDCVFLNRRLHLVTITARSIKWYDSTCSKEITIIPADDTFDLTIMV